MTPTIAWMILLAAGLLEIVWATCMKASDGFTKTPYTIATFVAAWLSFWLLANSLKVLPIGSAYAAWTGIGAVGAAAVGILWLGESASLLRIGCIALIVLGIVGLKLAEPS